MDTPSSSGSSTVTQPTTTNTSPMIFGTDAVVPEPSKTNTQNYTVLTSDQAKQDYLAKQNFLDSEQQKIIQQTMQNQQNNQSALDVSKERAAGKSSSDSLNHAADALIGSSGNSSPYTNGKDATGGLNAGYSMVNGQLTYTGSQTPAKGQATTANGNSYTSTGDPYQDSLAGNNADLQAMYKQTQTQLATAATTAGLNTSQQSQLTNLSTIWDNLISQQGQANDFAQGSATMGSIRNGSSRYAGDIAMGNVKQVIDQGLAKIADLTSKKQTALDAMQQGFISDNTKAVQDAYKNYTDMSKQVSDNIKEMHTAAVDAQKQQLDVQKYNLDVQKQASQDQQDARDFAIKNNVNTQAYQIGNKVYDTASGQEVDASKVDPSQIHVIDPNSQAAADYVKTMSGKYGDSIFPTMTPEQAQAALKYSKIYQKEIRPPKDAAGESGKYKFSTEQSGRLMSSGLTNANVQDIQTNLNNGYSIDEILKGMGLDDSKTKAVKDVMGGVTTTQADKPQSTYNTDFKPWVWQNFPRENISKAAKAAGFKSDKNQDNAADKYIESLVNSTKPYKSSGRSDQEIMDTLTEQINKDLQK